MLADHSAGVVQRSSGTVDGIMALFGAPTALKDNAFRACVAASAVSPASRYPGHPAFWRGRCGRARSLLLGDCADAGDVAPDDQRLDGLVPSNVWMTSRSTMCFDQLAVEQYSVASQQVSRFGKHRSRSGRVVELAKPGEGVAEPALLGEPGHLQAVQLHRGDVGPAERADAFYVVFRWFEDYLLVPKVIGRAVKVPGGVTVVAVLIGAALLGIVGALVAIPVAAALQLLAQELLFPALDEA